LQRKIAIGGGGQLLGGNAFCRQGLDPYARGRQSFCRFNVVILAKDDSEKTLSLRGPKGRGNPVFLDNKNKKLDPHVATLLRMTTLVGRKRPPLDDKRKKSRFATLATTVLLAILATAQPVEGTVIGTFRQESEKIFVPSLPSEPVKTIDFSINHGSLPIQQGDLRFSTTGGTGISYNATDGYYEAAETATGRLTFPTKSRIKLTVEPITLEWDTKKDVAGLSAISGAGYWYNFGRLGFDGSKLLAISLNGHVATSIDGINWTQQGNRPLYDATEQASWYMGTAYGNGTWVVVNRNGYVATSTDGTVWTSREQALPNDNNYHASLIFANGLFMTQNVNDKKIYTSPDGITWTQRGNCPAVARVMGYGAGRWIAGQGNMYASQDNGDSWTTIDHTLGDIHGGASDDNAEWYGTCFVGGRHYAINYSSEHLASSLDGSNWKNLGTNPSFKNFRGINYLNGSFISLKQDGKSLFVTNVGSRSVQFSDLLALTGGTTNDEYPIAASREFVIESSQISGEDGADEYHIDFDITKVRLVSVEQEPEPTETEAIPADIIFYPATQVNQAGNKVVAAIASDSRFHLSETKVHLLEGSTVLSDFVCDPTSVADDMIPLGVQADLGTRTIELKGDWSKFQDAPFTTTGAGTLKIATENSMPQSDITIRDGGALEFTGDLDYTTGAGTVLDLRGCSSVSGGKSLTLGAGGKLIF
jgi:hypothetical protein